MKNTIHRCGLRFIAFNTPKLSSNSAFVIWPSPVFAPKLLIRSSNKASSEEPKVRYVWTGCSTKTNGSPSFRTSITSLVKYVGLTAMRKITSERRGRRVVQKTSLVESDVGYSLTALCRLTLGQSSDYAKSIYPFCCQYPYYQHFAR